MDWMGLKSRSLGHISERSYLLSIDIFNNLFRMFALNTCSPKKGWGLSFGGIRCRFFDIDISTLTVIGVNNVNCKT